MKIRNYFEHATCNDDILYDNTGILYNMLEHDYKVIYQYKNMIILRRDHEDFIVWNVNQPYKENGKHHTHLKSFDVSKTLCKKVADNIYPNKNSDKYLIMSYIYLTENDEYKRRLEELLETRKNKSKQLYYNNKKCV